MKRSWTIFKHRTAALPGLGAVLLATGLDPAQAQPLDCLIEPTQVVEVRASVEGVIANVLVRRGDSIRRGQVLVELQSAAERAAVEVARHRAKMVGAVDAARHRVAYTRAKLERQTMLQAQNFTSAQALDEAEAERRLAEAELVVATENQEAARLELRRAEEQLALRSISAPFNGVVLDRLLHPGDLAEAGSGRKPVLRIAQIDPLKVDIIMPAALSATVKPGMRATISPKGLPGRHLAPITMIDRVMDPASATLLVRVDLPNPGQTIIGGVRCTAEIEGVSLPLPARPAVKPMP